MSYLILPRPFSLLLTHCHLISCRHVAGVSAIFADILADLAQGRRKGLLLVGAPGVGKTTLLRCDNLNP